ncbi:iron-siderophore ABC transporter substrate-binding protein [Chlorogloeopsis sp. ULAP02]|uniref:iron-siderophore ABC transporter substrate-binding protein n=1 Tax=Chlorogloeopsis sp. ULAP02 TaxID=3107926 RepID=UPI0031360FBE
MKKQSYRLIKPFLLMAFSLLVITACYQPVIQTSHLSLKPAVECRVIQHKFGETCVPLKPQRIIALAPRETLDPLLALGIKPIGFASYNSGGKEGLFGVSFEEVKGTKNVGDSLQPSLEKILMLKPDLILSSDFGNAHQKYKLLSAIAPTVSVPNDADIPAIDWENKTYFKENLRYIAKLIGQEIKAEEVLNKYQKRTEELKKRLGNQLQQIEVSVIFYGEGYIWTIAKSDTISHVLTDIGLRHKFVPRGEWNLSIETINKYDADVLFIVDVDKRSPSFYFQNPMFSSLKVVKNNRAYVVSQENWRGFGISGANKILDDLFKYLPEAT